MIPPDSEYARGVDLMNTAYDYFGLLDIANGGSAKNRNIQFWSAFDSSGVARDLPATGGIATKSAIAATQLQRMFPAVVFT